MKHLAPEIFREFACAAGGCPDSCCRAGWEIVIDPETLSRYETLPGPDGDRVRAAVVRGTGAVSSANTASAEAPDLSTRPMSRSDAEKTACAADGEALLRQDAARVCVLLDPDGLCCAQKRFGHESLCRVCREYPRFHREFGNLTEHGISLSCPAAFALAVSQMPKWAEWEDDSPIVPNDLDPERYLLLRDGRELALRFLTEESRPLQERLALVLELARRLQRGLDGKKRIGSTACRRLRNSFGQEAALRKTFRRSLCPTGSAAQAVRPLLRASSFQRKPAYRRAAHTNVSAEIRCTADLFSGLEILSPEWAAGLGALKAALPVRDLLQSEWEGGQAFLCTDSITGSESPSLSSVRGKQATRQPQAVSDKKRSEIYARYLWYSLYKYWLDAVDDGLLLARVKRSFAMTQLGFVMDRLVPRKESWLRRISREIEHCEENLDALLRQYRT